MLNKFGCARWRGELAKGRGLQGWWNFANGAVFPPLLKYLPFSFQLKEKNTNFI